MLVPIVRAGALLVLREAPTGDAQVRPRTPAPTRSDPEHINPRSTCASEIGQAQVEKWTSIRKTTDIAVTQAEVHFYLGLLDFITETPEKDQRSGHADAD